MIYDRGVDLKESEVLEPDERTAGAISYRLGDMHAPSLVERRRLRNVMTEFAEAISEDRSPLTDGNFGVRVLELA